MPSKRKIEIKPGDTLYLTKDGFLTNKKKEAVNDEIYIVSLGCVLSDKGDQNE